MNLVDVHCHLNHMQFQPDLNEVLDRAKKAGVKAIVVSGVNPSGNKEVQKLTEDYPFIKWSYGIYPIDALGLSEGETGLPRQTVPINLDEEFAFIRKHQDKIVSIGEIGMDFHWDQFYHEKQEENFRKILRFALEIKKPVVIHSRKAEKECIDLLEREVGQKIPVVMHCFSGKKSLIKRASELGYYFSIPPNIVNSESFQGLIKMVDLKQILTETDAPWLSPFKGQRNEPAFVMETIKKIAEIKGISVEETAKQIWENYERVFKR